MELRAGTQTQLRQSGSDLFVDHVFVPEIVFGSATLLDAQGNPKPDPAVHNPATFNPDTILIAIAYPDPIDNGTGQVTTFHGGDMHFRRTGGAGAEAWSWVAGSFRASNGNGNYQRAADRVQKCEIWDYVTGDGVATTYSDAKTLPATFASLASTASGALGSKSSNPTSITDWTSAAGSINTSLQPGLSSVTATIRTTDDAALPSGTRVGWTAHLAGAW
jgi:hypothetical protein